MKTWTGFCLSSWLLNLHKRFMFCNVRQSWDWEKPNSFAMICGSLLHLWIFAAFVDVCPMKSGWCHLLAQDLAKKKGRSEKAPGVGDQRDIWSSPESGFLPRENNPSFNEDVQSTSYWGFPHENGNHHMNQM